VSGNKPRPGRKKNEEREFSVSYRVILLYQVKQYITYIINVVKRKKVLDKIIVIINVMFLLLSSIFRVVSITPVGIVKDVQVCMLYYRTDARPAVEHHRAQHFTTHEHRPEITFDLFNADF